MSLPDLVGLYKTLPLPRYESGIAARFAAVPIPGYESHRIARDSVGNPCLLISLAHLPAYEPRTTLHLEHLNVVHGVECNISHNDTHTETGVFSIITCVNADSLLQEHFLQITTAIIAGLGAHPTASDVAHAVDRLVELFRLMIDEPHKSPQGFWAELYVIAGSSDPATLVASWHSTKHDTFDFHFGSQRIEIKSASGRRRQHYFSLAQLCPPTGTRVLVASVLLEPAGSGLSLADLVYEVRSRIAMMPDLVSRLDEIVAASLGNAWRIAPSLCFDPYIASTTLTFFWAEQIPKVDPVLPPNVSDVHFRVDLEDLPEVDRNELRAQGSLFAAIMPG